MPLPIDVTHIEITQETLINPVMNKKYIIFNVSEVNLIDFDQVLETSADTLRISIDGFKTFVKWEGETPSCINTLTTKEGPYTHSEIISILAGNAWTEPAPEPTPEEA